MVEAQGFLPRWVVEEGSQGLVILCCYNWYAYHYYQDNIKLLAILFWCCKIAWRCYSSIGLASTPFTLAFCSSVHYIASPFHLMSLHKCLECLGVCLASMLDTHACLFIFVFAISSIGAIRRWSPGAGDPRWSLLRREDPRRPGVVRRFPGKRPASFRSSCCYLCWPS